MQRWSGQRTGCVLLFSCFLALGCKEREVPRGAQPEASRAPTSSVCKQGGGTARFEEALFVRAAFGYCIDPHGETRAYGSGAPAPLDEVCEQLFGADCATYVEGGLERVTTLRYVSDRAMGGRVDVKLLRFARRAQAFGFFTKRVLGGGDPAEVRRVPLDAGGGAALGVAVVDVWRGMQVLELAYGSERETPEQSVASSARILPELARALGDRMVGDKAPLEEVALLPEQNLLPLGVSYESNELLGVSSTGPGAIGHYRDGERRYQVLAALRDDEQGAVDLRETLARAGAWRRLEKEDAIEVRFPPVNETPAQRWVFAQRGNALVGVGDPRFGTSPPSDEPKRELESKLRKLRKTISDNRLPPPKRKKNPQGS